MIFMPCFLLKWQSRYQQLPRIWVQPRKKMNAAYSRSLWTTGVNFINILIKPFSYESAFHSFSLVTFWLCNFFGSKILTQKVCIKCCWNWHMGTHILFLKGGQITTICLKSSLKTYYRCPAKGFPGMHFWMGCFISKKGVPVHAQKHQLKDSICQGMLVEIRDELKKKIFNNT